MEKRITPTSGYQPEFDLENENRIWLQSTYSLRKLIGIFGMLLPFLLILFLYVDNGYNKPLISISHYYFTRVSGIFVVIVSILALFLILYKGKEKIDFYLSSIAGIAALLVVFFPTDNLVNELCNSTQKHVVTVLSDSDFRKTFHYASAAVFFLCLSYMTLFLFTKSDKLPEYREVKKIIRNRIYRVCGVLMIVALLVMFVGGYLELIPTSYYDANCLTFWMETLAVESFGFAWLVKGEALFKD